MTVYSATRAGGTPTTVSRRSARPDYDPLKERSKYLADVLWERARDIAKILAPDVPADSQELSPFVQWMLLEKVAINFSPAAWDNPEAINDLYKLRKQFAPDLAHEWLPAAARYQQKLKGALPNPEVTPQSPEWKKQQRRLAR